MTELQRIKAIASDPRFALDRRAMRWAAAHNAPRNTLREAITAYLSALDPFDPEWSDWVDAYGEGRLSSLFGCDL